MSFVANVEIPRGHNESRFPQLSPYCGQSSVLPTTDGQKVEKREWGEERSWAEKGGKGCRGLCMSKGGGWQTETAVNYTLTHHIRGQLKSEQSCVNKARTNPTERRMHHQTDQLHCHISAVSVQCYSSHRFDLRVIKSFTVPLIRSNQKHRCRCNTRTNWSFSSAA